MITKHVTQFIFWSAVFVSLVSAALAFAGGDIFLILIGLSLGFNLWSLIKSEREGFVRSSQVRRAYEPARHFNASQIMTVVGLTMAELGVAAFVILE